MYFIHLTMRCNLYFAACCINKPSHLTINLVILQSLKYYYFTTSAAKHCYVLQVQLMGTIMLNSGLDVRAKTGKHLLPKIVEITRDHNDDSRLHAVR